MATNNDKGTIVGIRYLQKNMGRRGKSTGPIERPDKLIPQLKQEHSFDKQAFNSGILRIIWGLFKKVVVADRVALLVNMVYSHPNEYSSPAIILATFRLTGMILAKLDAPMLVLQQ